MKTTCNTSKLTAALKNAMERYTEDSTSFSVHISMGNRKMGAIPSVSLLPVLTCPKCAESTCASHCYAKRYSVRYKETMKAYAENTVLFSKNPDRFFDEIANFCKMQRYFRWQVAGDIVNDRYLVGMVKVAKSCPHCMFLAFTKKYDLVENYLGNGGKLPNNLNIVLSGWGDLQPENKFGLPVSQVIFKGETPNDEWKICGGNCTECACRGIGCWELKKGETIAFYEH